MKYKWYYQDTLQKLITQKIVITCKNPPMLAKLNTCVTCHFSPTLTKQHTSSQFHLFLDSFVCRFILNKASSNISWTLCLVEIRQQWQNFTHLIPKQGMLKYLMCSRVILSWTLCFVEIRQRWQNFTCLVPLSKSTNVGET